MHIYQVFSKFWGNFCLAHSRHWIKEQAHSRHWIKELNSSLKQGVHLLHCRICKIKVNCSGVMHVPIFLGKFWRFSLPCLLYNLLKAPTQDKLKVKNSQFHEIKWRRLQKIAKLLKYLEHCNKFLTKWVPSYECL